MNNSSPDTSNGALKRGTLVRRTQNFDINNFADDAMFENFVDKGKCLRCLMVADDRGARNLEFEKRNPPSAASPWTLPQG